MADENPKRGKAAGEPKGLAERIGTYADIVLKLTPAVFTLAGTWFAATYQSQSSGISLLNQREQAETQLRATMFANLIGPIAGARGTHAPDPEDERLLVEMLTLNFHEHVEFKPLLAHADARLVAKMGERTTTQDARVRLMEMRRSLQSVVRRVLDRQLSVLQKECDRGGYTLCSANSLADRNSCAEPGTLSLRGNPQCIAFAAGDDDNPERGHAVVAPDGKYSLKILMGATNWAKKLVEVHVTVTDLKGGAAQDLGTLDFGLTPYDLPFTDNSFLDNKHRFAVVVKDILTRDDLPPGAIQDGKFVNRVNLWVVWFPEGYVLPHERPINIQEIRNVLHLD